MTNLKLKSCPRCLGDMMVEEMLGEADAVCLQCGYRLPLPRKSIFQRELTASKR
jgi:hypothetical protein